MPSGTSNSDLTVSVAHKIDGCGRCTGFLVQTDRWILTPAIGFPSGPRMWINIDRFGRASRSAWPQSAAFDFGAIACGFVTLARRGDEPRRRGDRAAGDEQQLTSTPATDCSASSCFSFDPTARRSVAPAHPSSAVFRPTAPADGPPVKVRPGAIASRRSSRRRGLAERGCRTAPREPVPARGSSRATARSASTTPWPALARSTIRWSPRRTWATSWTSTSRISSPLTAPDQSLRQDDGRLAGTRPRTAWSPVATRRPPAGRRTPERRPTSSSSRRSESSQSGLDERRSRRISKQLRAKPQQQYQLPQPHTSSDSVAATR